MVIDRSGPHGPYDGGYVVTHGTEIVVHGDLLEFLTFKHPSGKWYVAARVQRDGSPSGSVVTMWGADAVAGQTKSQDMSDRDLADLIEDTRNKRINSSGYQQLVWWEAPAGLDILEAWRKARQIGMASTFPDFVERLGFRPKVVASRAPEHVVPEDDEVAAVLPSDAALDEMEEAEAPSEPVNTGERGSLLPDMRGWRAGLGLR